MVPAPPGFSDLRAFIEKRGVWADELAGALGDYLGANPMPEDDDAQFQAWTYREAISNFMVLIEPGGEPRPT